jgi:CDP-paratose 2-epimerase
VLNGPIATAKIESQETSLARILITGGAGFIGSSLALSWKRSRPDDEVVAFDNLRRAGSELAVDRLKRGGVGFVHGDVRNPEDFDQIGSTQLVIDCAAEPSVQAGYGSSSAFLVHNNLFGTVNCLEFCKRHEAGLIFLSTSRVYPIAGLRALPLEELKDRLELKPSESGPGWSGSGLRTDFPLDGSRSLYGATKLSSELLIQEYSAMYGLPAVIDRCGVVAGPWQMGRVDQGFISLFAARHLWQDPLQYIGFGGNGKQVRDVLHVDDLFELVELQARNLKGGTSPVWGVGGGHANSTSLKELSGLCAERCQKALAIDSSPETHPADVPYFVNDNQMITDETGWQPKRTIETLLDDVFSWLREHESELQPLLRPRASENQS